MSSDNILVSHRIFCARSGVQIATMEFLSTAGAVPYISNWKDTVAYHPLFSLSFTRLCNFAQAEWNRLAQIQDPRDSETINLRVAYLALLYELGSLRQEIAGIPPLHIVQSTLPGLHTLACWKNFLESKRFKFPEFILSDRNKNAGFENITEYLSLCFDIKEAYENKVSEAAEREKVRRAEAALSALGSTWITPPNKKILWHWVRANLPALYAPDAEGWLATLFLGSDKTVLEFEKEDIQLAEEIIVSSCPAGTGIMHAVRARLTHLLKVWESEKEAWEIDYASLEDKPIWVNEKKLPASHPGAEPEEKEFDKRWQFLQAHAKWEIALKIWQQEQEQNK